MRSNYNLNFLEDIIWRFLGIVTGKTIFIIVLFFTEFYMIAQR